MSTKFLLMWNLKCNNYSVLYNHIIVIKLYYIQQEKECSTDRHNRRGISKNILLSERGPTQKLLTYYVDSTDTKF